MWSIICILVLLGNHVSCFLCSKMYFLIYLSYPRTHPANLSFLLLTLSSRLTFTSWSRSCLILSNVAFSLLFSLSRSKVLTVGLEELVDSNFDVRLWFSCWADRRVCSRIPIFCCRVSRLVLFCCRPAKSTASCLACPREINYTGREGLPQI